jgi:hypothetical protein
MSRFYGNHFYTKILPSVGESRKVYPRDQRCGYCGECVCVCSSVRAREKVPHVTNIYTFGLHSKFTLYNVFNDVSSHLLKTSFYILTL